MINKVKIKKLLIISLLPTFLLLSNCRYLTGDEGMFRDRRGDYLEAPIEPQMRVPETLDSFTLDQLYVVPEEVFISSESFEGTVPRPKALDTNRPEGVVIRSFSDENWIVVAASPGQVWPRVRDLWVQAAIELEYENPVEGIMETGWIVSSGEGNTRDKYRIIIEPGLREGSSEVFVIHINRPWNSVGMELVVWPERSESEEKEYEILEQVSQYLADRTDIYSSSSSSLLAGNIAGETKAALLEVGSNDSLLELRISMSRAWGQVAQALERAEISIIERNQENSVIDVEFAGVDLEEDTPGFLARVFTSDNRQNAELGQQFRITFEETQSGIHVVAEALDETETSQQLEAELLQLILSNLG